MTGLSTPLHVCSGSADREEVLCKDPQNQKLICCSSFDMPDQKGALSQEHTRHRECSLKVFRGTQSSLFVVWKRPLFCLTAKSSMLMITTGTQTKELLLRVVRSTCRRHKRLSLAAAQLLHACLPQPNHRSNVSRAAAGVHTTQLVTM